MVTITKATCNKAIFSILPKDRNNNILLNTEESVKKDDPQMKVQETGKL